MASTGFVRGEWAELLVEWLVGEGRTADAEAMKLRLANFDSEHPIPCPVWHSALDDTASSLSVGAILGLGLGTMVEARHCGVAAYLALSANTLGDALEICRRYEALYCGGFTIEVVDLSHLVEIRWVSDVSHLITSIMGMLALVVFVQRETGLYCPPSRVAFAAAGSELDRELCEAHFHCPVCLGADHDSIVFPSSYLELPMRQRSSQVAEALQEKMDCELDRCRQRARSLEMQLKQTIGSMLLKGSASLVQAAQSMCMSSRTLQRKLLEAGLSWHELLDEVRHELADKYLHDSTLSIGDIAVLLGYAEPGNLTKAFRRWHGITPQEFRKQLCLLV